MKLIISLILLLLVLPNISALDFGLDSPDEVKLNEEFTATINADTSDIYDVKIFVHTSEDQKITSDECISEIYNNDWENPWYYLKESFPDKKQYKIRVISNSGNQEICARLRKTGASAFDTKCNPIAIKDSEIKEPEQTPEEPEKQSREKISFPSPEKTISPAATNDTKLTLNSPAQQTLKPLTTKQGKTRAYLAYSFTIFTIIIIILLALRKL